MKETQRESGTPEKMKATYQEKTEERTRTKEKPDARARLRSLGIGLLYALCGYGIGFATIPFGAAPFGIAMLCAVDRRVLYVYAGLCLSAYFGESRLVLLGAYTAILLVRLLVRFLLDVPWSEGEGEKMGEKTLGQVWPLLFREQIGLRMATAAIAAFGVGLSRLIRDGFLYYDLYGTILMTLVAPVAVLLFTGYWGTAPRSGERYVSGLLSIATVLIWAMRGTELYGISLGAMGAMLMTLYMTRSRGLVVGVLTGTVCGLAVSVSLAPSFAFGALAAGILFPVSVFFAAASALSVALAWGSYVEGLGVLNGLLSALLTACLLFPVLDKLFGRGKEKKHSRDAETATETEEEPVCCRPLTPLEQEGISMEESRRRLTALGEGILAISETFREMGERERIPTVSDLRQICDNAFDSACVSCSERAYCWEERHHETAGEIGRICAALHKSGQVGRQDASALLVSRCGRLPDILEGINHNTALHRRQIEEGDRTEIFALDYRAFSELLNRAIADKAGTGEDTEITERLCRALTDLHVGLTGSCVEQYGRRRVLVRGKDRERMRQEEGRIRETVRQVCSFAVREGRFSQSDEPILIFEERETLSVALAKRSVCAVGEEELCGDTVQVFRGVDGNLYALISDGMGAGREAAITSDISGIFLQRLLSANLSCDTALEMLNTILRSRSGGSLHECSATVDLMSLDLFSAKAFFYKSGAAPTYVLRKGNLIKLRSHTVPIGIIRELDTRRIELDVCDGDLIVMVSDGVTQGREECPWLFDLLRGAGERESPEGLADEILRHARREGSTDDASVLVMRVKK